MTIGPTPSILLGTYVCASSCVFVTSGECKVVIDNEVRPSISLSSSSSSSSSGVRLHRQRPAASAAYKSRHELCIVTRNEIIGNYNFYIVNLLLSAYNWSGVSYGVHIGLHARNFQRNIKGPDTTTSDFQNLTSVTCSSWRLGLTRIQMRKRRSKVMFVSADSTNQ